MEPLLHFFFVATHYFEDIIESNGIELMYVLSRFAYRQSLCFRKKLCCFGNLINIYFYI